MRMWAGPWMLLTGLDHWPGLPSGRIVGVGRVRVSHMTGRNAADAPSASNGGWPAAGPRLEAVLASDGALSAWSVGGRSVAAASSVVCCGERMAATETEVGDRAGAGRPEAGVADPGRDRDWCG